jgi:hypothetical protein
MAAAGTLLQDLDSSSSGGDGDLVQKILADMNIPTTSTARSVPPPMPTYTPAQHQQVGVGNTSMTMDSQIPTSHMIGNEHPTPADFAAAMTGVAGMRPTEGMMGGAPLVAMPGATQTYEAPSKNLYSRILDELKVPFVVAILFFLFSLPPVRILMAHYVPRFIKATGEFNTMGLAFVALLNGVTFWLLQRVIAPLLSL